MAMYKRPTERKPETVQFPAGLNQAKIEGAKLSISKNGDTNMIVLKLVGSLNEVGYYNLTFGNSMTDTNLMYILASIEDHGVVIPEIDFGYNQLTVNFLKGKSVFINVVKKKYQGKARSEVEKFLNANEFGIEQHGREDLPEEMDEELGF
ncbi:type III secretion system protein PrgE [Weissella muntiaci]|uniref:Type III secretion system protein PrgE n=1 Tax=Weissella muntiaci TaxID=2508881 RepID=A0A6C2C1X6_9LACO|nr:type III secretion system protein PrgE [Weissella muntiaci]TYC47998.1 type III secretion system protein PrgE [Weissella muntiaci]